LSPQSTTYIWTMHMDYSNDERESTTNGLIKYKIAIIEKACSAWVEQVAKAIAQADGG